MRSSFAKNMRISRRGNLALLMRIAQDQDNAAHVSPELWTAEVDLAFVAITQTLGK